MSTEKILWNNNKNINEMKRQNMEWEICANHVSHKGLISKIYQELIIQINTKTSQRIQFKNGQRTHKDIFPKK